MKWLKGKSFLSFDNKNFGSIIKNDIDSFTTAVEEVLFERKKTEVWLTTSEIKKEPPNTNISITENDDENGLEIIWETWKDLFVDDETQKQCLSSVKALEFLLHDLIEQCLNAGIYPFEKNELLGEWTGQALAKLSRGSFLIGIEYQNCYSNNLQPKSEKPSFFMKLASQDAEKLLALFLMQLIEKERLPISEAENIGKNGGKLISDAMVSCFKIGFNYRIADDKKRGGHFADLNKDNLLNISPPYVIDKPKKNIDIQELIGDLKDPLLKNEAILLLIKLGKEVVPYINPLLRNVDPDVRIVAMKILAAIEKQELEGE